MPIASCCKSLASWESPIAGETEVFGQFRHFADAWSDRAAFFQNVYADVKSVRRAHLSHLGSQSYGSWARKKIDSADAVHVVGSGQLAQEILVWLKKQNSQITLYSRTPELASERLEQALGETMNGVNVQGLQQPPALRKSVVVIASPLKTSEIQFLARRPKSQTCDRFA